ncbi:DUF2851 family protein [Apibacter raozihei]|uniref:DUF2851 family protein n=1 Tax=Apibacter raozihei TaxID=2500547 RepID=UPI000FE4107D|nr:DUF2851 family protein [Apibacter raozihei]
MNESFLHYVWMYKKFELFDLRTTSGEKLEIIHCGTLNPDSGPDFNFAKVIINGTEWAGNVEIHVKSSDWIKHKHDLNPNYDNIVLHIVYEDDQEILSLKLKKIPTLELKNYIAASLIDNYTHLEKKAYSFIPCEKLFTNLLPKLSIGFTEKQFFCKLEEKQKKISQLLILKNNDWEAVLASVLAYSFGLKINAEAFEQIFMETDYKILRKQFSNLTHLESLLFGLCFNLDMYEDEYAEILKEQFKFLQVKYRLTKTTINLKFSKLRPANFPTIRLSQLSCILTQYQNLFSYVIGAKTLQHYIYILDDVQASSYWNNHYVFDKISSHNQIKKLSSSQKELIILNAFLPIKFAYSKSIGKCMDDEIISIMEELSPEKNTVIQKFENLGISFNSALETQAFLHLYKNQCLNKKCLKCDIGYNILK